MYRFRKPEPSYWEATQGDAELEAEELRGDEQCEVAIIGGGYTGLSAAYQLPIICVAITRSKPGSWRPGISAGALRDATAVSAVSVVRHSASTK
jgi:hypothetical protein